MGVIWRMPAASSEHVERIQYSLHSSAKTAAASVWFCAVLMTIVQRVA